MLTPKKILVLAGQWICRYRGVASYEVGVVSLEWLLLYTLKFLFLPRWFVWFLAKGCVLVGGGCVLVGGGCVLVGGGCGLVGGGCGIF